MVTISTTVFISSWTIKGFFLFFFISVILQAGCNEIESNIVNCRMCLVVRGIRKKKVKIRTQIENIVETDIDVWY